MKSSDKHLIDWRLIILTTFSLACISRSFRLANTCMCDDTCFLVRVFPVRSFMYLAINSLRPAKKQKYISLSHLGWRMNGIPGWKKRKSWTLPIDITREILRIAKENKCAEYNAMQQSSTDDPL